MMIISSTQCFTVVVVIMRRGSVLVINPSVRRRRVIVVGLCVWLSNFCQYMILLAIVFMCNFQHFYKLCEDAYQRSKLPIFADSIF